MYQKINKNTLLCGMFKNVKNKMQIKVNKNGPWVWNFCGMLMYSFGFMYFMSKPYI